VGLKEVESRLLGVLLEGPLKGVLGALKEEVAVRRIEWTPPG
jgi:hypothetical protein